MAKKIASESQTGSAQTGSVQASEVQAKKIGGTERMKRVGRHPVMLGLLPDDLAVIDQARGYEPRASYIVRTVVAAAKLATEGK